MDVNPGPIDSSVLTLQHTHRSTDIWAGKEPPALICRHKSYSVYGLIEQNVQKDIRLLHYIRAAGFYGVYRVGHLALDHALITALVERWRQETHTFHLLVGESTVTLEDVEVLLGLRVDGLPVIGLDGGYANICQELLGITPPPTRIHGSRLEMPWLMDMFGEIPDNANDVTVQRYARAYILLLIGGSIFPDKSGNKVKLMFLHLLSDLGQAGCYSWGSAALACLYREMCRSSKKGAKGIGGPLILLQFWVWERIPHISPGVKNVISIQDIANDDAPLGIRWRTTKINTDSPTHVLRYYRDQLDRQRWDQMIWQPYTPDIMQSLPEYCKAGANMWMYMGPLICYYMVEMHNPDRVLCQFGRQQHVPKPCDTNLLLHNVKATGRVNTNWATEMADHIQRWNNRSNYVVQAPIAIDPMPPNGEYMYWYKRVTRRLISPLQQQPLTRFQPSGSFIDTLVREVAELNIKSNQCLETDDDPNVYKETVRYFANRTQWILDIASEYHRYDQPIDLSCRSNSRGGGHSRMMHFNNSSYGDSCNVTSSNSLIPFFSKERDTEEEVISLEDIEPQQLTLQPHWLKRVRRQRDFGPQ